MSRIKLSIIIFLLVFTNFKTYSVENVFVSYKINNQIITNIDIINESKYLIALNNQLKNLTKKKNNSNCQRINN
jgi:peptidyl-prolyl cis-trans isomerase SurA